VNTGIVMDRRRAGADEGGLTVTVTLSNADWPLLDPVDQRLLDECARDDATISDRLLALQTIFFRMEQQRAVLAQRTAE
jgi:hypothetical protein